MDINRNNYEEYFLLYADDELTDSEKAAVLMFLKENKDLEEEFRMIHHTICRPEVNIELGDKSFLLRGKGASFINENNYEEIFVLYHDNELTGRQKKETEDFLSRHSNLKSEFELIGMAKLIPEESVIFPNKRQLYKKERTGKVVPVIFWRALVAAVFIGAGLWITDIYILKETKKPAVAVQSNSSKQPVPVIEKRVTPDKKAANNMVQSPESNPVIEKSIAPDKKAANNMVQSSASNSRERRTEIIAVKEKLQKTSSQKNTGTLVKTSVKIQKAAARENPGDPSPENKNINNEEKIDNETVALNEKAKSISEEEIAGDNKINLSKELARKAIRENDNVQAPISAKNTSYIPDTNDNSQNYVFYDITTEEFKRTKVSSFLKKVKRVIERNNPISRLLTGNDKQVVSN